MQVFCIGNQLYTDNQYDLRPQGEAYKLLSGIPELREYCQSVPAEAQANFVDNFLRNVVPALLGSGRQWCLAGIDKLASEQGTVVCQVLREVEKSLREVRPSHYLGEIIGVEVLLTLYRNSCIPDLW